MILSLPGGTVCQCSQHALPLLHARHRPASFPHVHVCLLALLSDACPETTARQAEVDGHVSNAGCGQIQQLPGGLQHCLCAGVFHCTIFNTVRANAKHNCMHDRRVLVHDL